jgi:NDP-sugar pyrophosphorylase family protein
LSELPALVLAGGLGTRLRPVISDLPKVLAEVAGRPFMSHLLDRLMSAGFREVVLCTGYQGERVKAVYGRQYGCLRILYSQEVQPLGTAGALRLALPLFTSDTVLVTNGDSICEGDLGAFVDHHFRRNAAASIMLTYVNDTRRYGRLRIAEDYRIAGFDEKTASAGAGFINAGVYLLSRALIAQIPEHRPVSLEREMFPEWMRSAFYGYPAAGRFLDIGTPEAYASATAVLNATRSTQPM